MMPERDVPTLAPQLRVMRIIALALVQGLVLLLAVAAYNVFVANPGQAGGSFPIVSLLAAWVLVQNTMLAAILPGMLARNTIRKIAAGTWDAGPGARPGQYESDAAKLLAVRQTTLIVAWALIEGAGMFGGVAGIIERQPLVLLVPVISIGIILASFPTEARLRLWLQDQEDRLTDLRRAAEMTTD